MRIIHGKKTPGWLIVDRSFIAFMDIVEIVNQTYSENGRFKEAIVNFDNDLNINNIDPFSTTILLCGETQWGSSIGPGHYLYMTLTSADYNFNQVLTDIMRIKFDVQPYHVEVNLKNPNPTEDVLVEFRDYLKEMTREELILYLKMKNINI